jgi:hypothetical protein
VLSYTLDKRIAWGSLTINSRSVNHIMIDCYKKSVPIYLVRSVRRAVLLIVKTGSTGFACKRKRWVGIYVFCLTFILTKDEFQGQIVCVITPTHIRTHDIGVDFLK